MAENIKDFGEYIGGAKKELWAGRNLTLSDMNDFDDVDVKNYVNKNKIWKNPDWNALAEQGYDKTALYFIKLMKDSFPAKPEHFTVEEGKRYTEVLEKYRDRLMEIKTSSDIASFGHDDLLKCGVLKESASSYYRYSSTYFHTSKIDKLMRRKYDVDRIKKEAMDKGFLFTEEEKFRDGCSVIDLDGNRFKELITTQNDTKVSLGYRVDGGTRFAYSNDLSIMEKSKENRFAVIIDNYALATVCKSQKEAEQFIDALWKLKDAKSKEKEENKEETKETSNRKKKFTIKPLEKVEHISPFGDAENIEGQNFLDDFNIRGGEFGNWLNDKDRQENMNAAHDAFRDLAIALGIPDTDIGLNNKLNIAFGSRGQGDALAHYEPDREVINLTKMKGAGSLAHEFFHGLDNIMAKEVGVKSSLVRPQMLTSHMLYGDISKKFPAFKKLWDAIHYTPMNNDEIAKAHQEKLQQLIDKMNKGIKQCGMGYKKEPENKEVYDRFFNYCQSLYEKCLKGEELRSFEISGRSRNPKWVNDPEIVKTFKEFHKELGSDANIERNIDYLFATIENTASSVNYEKEKFAKGESVSTKDTNFYTKAQEMDKNYSKSGHGYWASDIEMMARAFACYVEDKLAENGIRNDYLCRPTSTKEGSDPSIPYGNERKYINECFDEMIQELKDKNLLNQRDYTYERIDNVTINDVDYQIALQDKNITLTDVCTKQQDTVIYGSKEEALQMFEDVMDKGYIEPEQTEPDKFDFDDGFFNQKFEQINLFDDAR